MLLAVDVGNTNIVIGVFSKSQLITSWRLATDSRRRHDSGYNHIVNVRWVYPLMPEHLLD